MNRQTIIKTLSTRYVQNVLGEMTLLHDEKLIEPTLAALYVHRNECSGKAR